MTKEYGEENPTLTATAGETGITGETAKIAGALKTTATKTSNVGTYVIGNDNVKLIDNGTFKASNYEMNFINGTLTITAAGGEGDGDGFDDEFGFEYSYGDNINAGTNAGSIKQLLLKMIQIIQKQKL